MRSPRAPCRRVRRKGRSARAGRAGVESVRLGAPSRRPARRGRRRVPAQRTICPRWRRRGRARQRADPVVARPLGSAALRCGARGRDRGDARARGPRQRPETAVQHAFGIALRGLGRADEAAEAYGRAIASLERGAIRSSGTRPIASASSTRSSGRITRSSICWSRASGRRRRSPTPNARGVARCSMCRRGQRRGQPLASRRRQHRRAHDGHASPVARRRQRRSGGGAPGRGADAAPGSALSPSFLLSRFRAWWAPAVLHPHAER
jgi:hypothetical protein